MTPAKLAAAMDLRSQGKKLEEIAATLSVSMSLLTRTLGHALVIGRYRRRELAGFRGIQNVV
ncbi:hypothetical protein [Arthrobacter sp.]|uniref:hypothetical protein n=1 Tax=Arthrobacter sp. TaxID=1667 RepID=UPI002811D2D5|nr:hypothetical protein [Arthrobacter sp.]